ncbi:MAG: TOBE domain-containing protein, partial [Pseudomonadota bacterium]
MNLSAPASLLVITPDQDDLERVQTLLMGSSLPVDCHWIADAESLPEERLPEPAPGALLIFNEEQLAETLAWRNQHVAHASALLVADLVDEPLIERALARGANDVISLGAEQRALNVIGREVRLAVADTTLSEAEEKVEGFREQVERLTSESSRAFVWAQEGVVADANLACVTLLGLDEVADLVGLPVMDLFATDCRVALKGALVACQKGMWRDDALRCRVQGNEGEPSQPVDAMLEADRFEGEDAVRIELAPTRREVVSVEAPEDDVPVAPEEPAAVVPRAPAPSSGSDPFLPFHQRRNFLQKVTDGLERSHAGGLRVIYHVRLDGGGLVRVARTNRIRSLDEAIEWESRVRLSWDAKSI